MHCQKCFAESPNTSARCIQCGEAFFEENKQPIKAPAEKPNSWVRTLGFVIGFCVGLYSGIYFLLLLAPTLIITWFGKKFLSGNAKQYIDALGVQAAQSILLIVLMVVMIRNGNASFSGISLAVDVVIPVVGLIWLVWKPGITSVTFLSVFQVGMLAFNAYVMYQLPVGDAQHKAVVAHMFWRVIALFYMWKSLTNGSPANAKRNS